MSRRAKQADERPIVVRSPTASLVLPTMKETAHRLGFALFNFHELSINLKTVFDLWFGHKNCFH